jgi:creatinine amidohydrolase
MSEVRITHLHPRELRKRRDACPVAWLPLGTIEWHGRHLPLGFDGVKAEAICVEAAREIGGVVFPPQYYADHRGVILEAISAPDVLDFGVTFDHRVECCVELGVSVAGVAANAARDHTREAGRQHVEVLERTYWMVRAYGFSRIVAVCGHYPNVSPALAAADRFHAKQSDCRVICGHEGILGDGGGDHAGAYETSQLMYLLPDLVRRDRLADDRPDEPTGIHGEHPRQATAERGKATVEEFVAGCRAKLGEIPPSSPLRDPDEDGVGTDWVDVLRAGGHELIQSAWS